MRKPRLLRWLTGAHCWGVIGFRLWCVFSSFGPTTEYLSEGEKRFRNNSLWKQSRSNTSCLVCDGEWPFGAILECLWNNRNRDFWGCIFFPGCVFLGLQKTSCCVFGERCPAPVQDPAAQPLGALLCRQRQPLGQPLRCCLLKRRCSLSGCGIWAPLA